MTLSAITTQYHSKDIMILLTGFSARYYRQGNESNIVRLA